MRTYFILLLSIACAASYGQSRFVTPIEGVYGEDYIIVNYVDWGLEDEIMDQHCLTKTYNGHQGTDYVLKSFRQMDEGVNVLAVDSGTVIFTLDGIYDREKTSVISKGLGNYVGITHRGNYQTYYGHLKKNSITVKEGDKVLPGQVIGQVASSGNSTDPHLHFELWYDSTYYIDPYKGPCGNDNSFWSNPDPFDSSFNVWTSSMWNGLPTLDTLREAPLAVEAFSQNDEQMTYWSLLYGLRLGDSLRIEWLDPDGTSKRNTGYRLIKDWWYYFYFNTLPIENDMKVGTWKVNFYRNDVLVDSKSFLFDKTSSSSTDNQFPHLPQIRQSGESIITSVSSLSTFRLYSMSGTLLMKGKTSIEYPVDASTLIPGIYLFTMETIDYGLIHKQVLIR